jgi:anti-sigma-K factor RskA
MDEATLDLLIASQTDGLQPAEARNLEAALESADPAEIMQTLRALDAARLALRGDEAGADDLPATLEAKLAGQAKGYFASVTAPVASGIPDREPDTRTFPIWTGYAGWLAAAAAIALAVVAFSTRTPTAPADPIAVLNARADTFRWDFAGLTDDMKGVKGQVVWNDNLQQGYMELTGLPENDPAQKQYQLWIVDPTRAEQPVDGGVFNAPKSGQRIAFAPRLPVDKPTTFAITAEKPGGVVVSKGPLLVAAVRK